MQLRFHTHEKPTAAERSYIAESARRAVRAAFILKEWLGLRWDATPTRVDLDGLLRRLEPRFRFTFERCPDQKTAQTWRCAALGHYHVVLPASHTPEQEARELVYALALALRLRFLVDRPCTPERMEPTEAEKALGRVVGAAFTAAWFGELTGAEVTTC